MTKQGTVKEIKIVKQGTSPKGRDWTLSKVILADGFSAATFDGYLYKVGSDVTLEVEKSTSTGKNGQTYENFNIVPSKPIRRGSVDPKIADKVLAKLESIEAGINDLSAAQVDILGKLDELIGRDMKQKSPPKSETPF